MKAIDVRLGLAVVMALAGLGLATRPLQAQEPLVMEWNGGGMHWVETEIQLEAGRTYRFQGGCFDASGLGIYKVHQFQLVLRQNGQVNTQYFDCIDLNLVYSPKTSGTYWMVFHVHTNSPDLQLWIFTHQLRVSLVDGSVPSATTAPPEPTVTPFPEATPTRVTPTATALASATRPPSTATPQPTATVTAQPTATTTVAPPAVEIGRLTLRMYLPGLIKASR